MGILLELGLEDLFFFKIIKKYNLSKIEHIFKEHGGWAVAIAGFTPLPYKVFTIASGVFVSNLLFFIASLRVEVLGF